MKEEKGIGASPQIFWPRTALGCSSVACRDAPLLSYIAFNSPQRRSALCLRSPVRSGSSTYAPSGVFCLRRPGSGLWAYYNCDSSTIRALHENQW